MADDLKNILIDNWDITIIAKDQIEYLEICPLEYFAKGVGLVRELTDYTPSGMTYKQSDFKSGHLFRIYFVDNSEANIDLRVSAITKICDAFTGNTYYDRLIPRNNEIVWDKGTEDRPMLAYRRVAQMPLIATKNNRNIYT